MSWGTKDNERLFELWDQDKKLIPSPENKKKIKKVKFLLPKKASNKFKLFTSER